MIKRMKTCLKHHEKLKEFLKRILLEFTPYGFLANYIIFPIMKFVRVYLHCPTIYRKVKTLKNAHKGQRCFILATGPSLKPEDVALLEKEYTIGVNSIYKMFERMSWKPTYYVMTDPMLFARTFSCGHRNVGSYSQRYSIVNALNRRITGNDEKVILIHNCWLDHIYHYGTSRRFKYSGHPEGGVYDYYSVTQECIYYAIYMGFQEIYLLGADNNFLGSFQHFEETEGEARISYEKALKAQRGNDWAYAYLKEIAEKKHVKIYNATRGGRVELFPRVSLEEIL